MDISETPLAKEIDKHDDVYAFMQSVTQQRKKGTIKIKPDKEGVGRYRELVNAYNRRKKKAKDMNKSNKSVIEYFDTYLANRGGELNESTSNELLEEAASDLIYLTEEVLHFTENVFVRAAQLAKAKQMKKGLKRSLIPITKTQRQRNVDRKVLSQTPAGRQTLSKVDDPKFIKKKKQALRTAVEKDPAAAKSHKVRTGHDIETKEPIYNTQHSKRVATDVETREPVMKTTTKKYTPVRSELQKGTEYGSKKAKEIAQTQHKAGQAVHSGMRKVAGKSPNVTDTGLLPGKSHAPKSESDKLRKLGKGAKKAAKYAGIGLGGAALATGLAVGMGHANESHDRGKDEEEKETPYQDHEKMRISQRLIRARHGEDWESRVKRSNEQKRGKETGNKKYFDNLVTNVAVAKQPHAQKSLVSVSDRTAIPVTDKGGKEVEKETKRAATSADSLMDIINKNPALKNRFEKGGTPKEREARGQGRLFPDEPTKKVPSHLKLGDGKGKGSPSDRFRTSIPLNRSSTERARTKTGSEAKK